MAMMAESNAAAMLQDLNARISGVAVALVSRDGVVLRAEMPPGIYTETFAIVCAALLGAAATASLELHRALPNRIVVEGNDSTTVIVPSGPKNFLVAVVGRETDPAAAAREVERFAGVMPGR